VEIPDGVQHTKGKSWWSLEKRKFRRESPKKEKRSESAHQTSISCLPGKELGRAEKRGETLSIYKNHVDKRQYLSSKNSGKDIRERKKSFQGTRQALWI